MEAFPKPLKDGFGKTFRFYTPADGFVGTFAGPACALSVLSDRATDAAMESSITGLFVNKPAGDHHAPGPWCVSCFHST